MQKRSRLSRIYFAVRWKRYKDDDGTPLTDLYDSEKDFPRGGTWTYSNYFMQISAVLAHGFRPSEFELCDPADDLSVIVSYEDTKARMQAYLEKKQRQKAKT